VTMLRARALLLVAGGIVALAAPVVDAKPQPKPKAPPMSSPFATAQAAFRREVAASHHRKPDSLKISPPVEEQVTWFDSHRFTTGALVAFEAEWPISPPPREGAREVTVRGFASPAGEVVLERRKNLGVLLREAHFLDEKQSLPAKALAERFLWMMLVQLGQPSSPVGPQPPSHKLLEGGGTYLLPPSAEHHAIRPPWIERRPDGSASLFFLYQNLDNIGGKGVVSQRLAEIRCSKDHVAEVIATTLTPDEAL
jgi:hypothetical protein